MTDTTRPIIKDVVRIIKAAAPIAALVSTRVYSRTPDNPVFPFIRITSIQAPFDTKTKTGMTHIVQLTAFDRSPDPERAATIREEIYNALHRQENAFTTQGVFSIIFNGTAPLFLDPDGITWNAVSQFEIQVLEE